VTERRPGTGRDELVEALFDQHYSGLCRLATLLTGDAAAAEEVVQEAFLRTYAGWWRIRQPERAQWYLRAAVVNQCRSRGRRRSSEDRGNRTVWATDGAPPRRWETDDVGETMAVLDAVRSLPRRQREAVVLRYYEDLSEADVAAALGCSVGTVKSQLFKARASLAEQLRDPDDRPGDGSGDGSGPASDGASRGE
jgi:RNA polymerase sigma-70 factor (sigma-E family)